MFNEVKINSVLRTKRRNLCVSCGICIATCPKSAIAMSFKQGLFLPVINSNCSNCGLCLEVCPGTDFNNSNDNKLLESSVDCYTGHFNDLKIRLNSASGGLITGLITQLLVNGEYDYAFVLPFTKFDGLEAKLVQTNDFDQIVFSAKSKYIPVSVENVIKVLKKQDNKKYIIVGTSCVIAGIRKFIKKFSYNDENFLFLGLFCERTLNFNVLDWYEKRFSKNNEKIKSFYFKSKHRNGWPGDTMIIFDSGREIDVNRSVRMNLKKFFQLKRCLYCTDKLNHLADISFGDCYIKGCENAIGNSSILIRTKKGGDLLNKYSKEFELVSITLKEVLFSQSIYRKNRLNPLSHVKDIIRVQIGSSLIYLGQHKWYLFINMFILTNKFLVFFKKIIFAILKRIDLIFTFVMFYFKSYLFWKAAPSDKVSMNNIIIVGGELFNKGAQAMTFTVIDQLIKYYPNKKFYLFSDIDFKRKEEEKNNYTFDILPWNLGIKLRILGIPTMSVIFNKGKVSNNEIKKLESVIKDSPFIVDVSGYALSSQWGFRTSWNYLLNIAIAKRFKINFYVLPQSIGPFNYSIMQKILLLPLIRRYLSYPRSIFVRENSGFNLLKYLKIKNVTRSNDIVLRNSCYSLNSIFKNSPIIREITVNIGSVGIIPNKRVFERLSQESLKRIYFEIISILLNNNISVCLLRHSFEDFSICLELKKMFLADPRVVLLENDLSAYEFEQLVKKFDFIIASRYHAIVHAYRNNIPSVVIGWADKYYDLMQYYEQTDYFSDCRNKLASAEIVLSVVKMLKENKKESVLIREINRKSSAESIFTMIR